GSGYHTERRPVRPTSIARAFFHGGGDAQLASFIHRLLGLDDSRTEKSGTQIEACAGGGTLSDVDPAETHRLRHPHTHLFEPINDDLAVSHDDVRPVLAEPAPEGGAGQRAFDERWDCKLPPGQAEVGEKAGTP